jgi:carbon-monoxide dehydrogenase large subunit
VRLDRYVIFDDYGRLLDPRQTLGQVHGGVVQGIGQALFEHALFDAQTGQNLSGSLMDYALPTASDIPAMQIVHQHSPSPLNPLGVKGVGEGGAVAPPAAIANAVCDALAAFGVEVNTTPIKPEQLINAMRPR